MEDLKIKAANSGYKCRFGPKCDGFEYWGGNFWYCDKCWTYFNDCPMQFLYDTDNYEKENGEFELVKAITDYRRQKYVLCKTCKSDKVLLTPAWVCTSCAPMLEEQLAFHFEVFGLPSFVRILDWWSRAKLQVVPVTFMTCFHCKASFIVGCLLSTQCPSCKVMLIDVRIGCMSRRSDCVRYFTVFPTSDYNPKNVYGAQYSKLNDK